MTRMPTLREAKHVHRRQHRLDRAGAPKMITSGSPGGNYQPSTFGEAEQVIVIRRPNWILT